jgi:hypothetical protein
MPASLWRQDRIHPYRICSLECAAVDTMDQLVLFVRQTAAPTPASSFCPELAGKRSMCFECLVMHDINCLSLADSGASISLFPCAFLCRHSTSYCLKYSSAHFVDGNPLAVLAFVTDLPLKMSSFRWTQSFLVVDIQ